MPHFSRSVPLLASASLLALAAPLVAQDTYNWVGGSSGTNRGLFTSGTSSSWAPTLESTEIATGKSNTFIIATRNNGSSEALIGGGLSLGVGLSARIGALVFDDTDGHFPANLIIGANQSSTSSRFLYVEVPNTTFITLTENTTGTVTIGYDRVAIGNLSFRLPDSGISTIHVAHPSAVLDLSGTFDANSGRGGISGGDAEYTGNHATLRKTGAGTLDLSTEDGQGHRVLGTIIEGGTVIISSTVQLGWTPTEEIPNEAAVVINGGTLRTTNPNGVTNSALRGFQIGDNGATLEITGASFRLPNAITDMPGQSGQLIKTGSGILGLQNAVDGGTYSAGTLLQQGQIHLVLGEASLGSADGLGLTASSGTTLRGNGGINGDSSFADGAILRPDLMSAATVLADPIGAFTFNHDLTLGDVTLIYDLAPGGVSDQIFVSGELNIGLGVIDLDNFTFTALTDFNGGTYTLLTATGGIMGSLGSNLTGTLENFPIELMISPGGDSIQLMVIPEPAAYAALFGLAALLAVRRRRQIRA